MAIPVDWPLLGRHDLYKAAQDKVVTWLVSAADLSRAPESFGSTASRLKPAHLVNLAERIRDAGVKVWPSANHL